MLQFEHSLVPTAGWLQRYSNILFSNKLYSIVLCSDYTTLAQIMQQEKTTRYCDVFSYGMVLWELLNYKQPFAELSDLDVRQNVLNRKVEHIVHIGIAF